MEIPKWPARLRRWADRVFLQDISRIISILSIWRPCLHVLGYIGKIHDNALMPKYYHIRPPSASGFVTILLSVWLRIARIQVEGQSHRRVVSDLRFSSFILFYHSYLMTTWILCITSVLTQTTKNTLITSVFRNHHTDAIQRLPFLQ